MLFFFFSCILHLFIGVFYMFKNNTTLQNCFWLCIPLFHFGHAKIHQETCPSNFLYLKHLPKLSAAVKTKRWFAPTFPMNRGSFRGETLSLLLHVYSPWPLTQLLIKLCNLLPSTGFRLNVPIPESAGLPPIGVVIYLEWNVPDHKDSQGWHLTTV